MRIVINDCRGEFDLSENAVQYYARHKGLVLYMQRGITSNTYYTKPAKDRKHAHDGIWSPKNIKRSDPILVRMVEEMKVDSIYSRLVIKEVDITREWCIIEDDGKEEIQYA